MATRADRLAYFTRHNRLRRDRGRAADHQCVACPEQAQEWAQVHTEDGEDPWADYVPMCRPCHLRYDLRSKITHCGYCGKPYDAENTYHRPDGGRDCRNCMRRRLRSWRAAQAAS